MQRHAKGCRVRWLVWVGWGGVSHVRKPPNSDLLSCTTSQPLSALLTVPAAGPCLGRHDTWNLENKMPAVDLRAVANPEDIELEDVEDVPADVNIEEKEVPQAVFGDSEKAVGALERFKKAKE